MPKTCETWNPKEYHDDGHTLLWGEDISLENMEALRGGEIFTLLNQDGTTHSRVMMNIYDEIHEKPEPTHA